jgi:hypothetical protein
MARRVVIQEVGRIVRATVDYFGLNLANIIVDGSIGTRED